MSADEVSALVKGFQTTETHIKTTYSKDIAAALNRVASADREAEDPKSEEGIAKNLAELFSSLNGRQIADLETWAKKARKEAEKKSPKDGRYIALLDRMYYAGRLLFKHDDPEWKKRYSKFRTEFLAQWTRAQKTSKDFYQLLRKALDPDDKVNGPAKAQIRKKYDRGAMLKFIDGQHSSGNVAFADQLSRAVSFRDQKGKDFVDALGPDSAESRIYLSSAPSQAIHQFSQAHPGLENFQTTLRPLYGGSFAIFKPEPERSENKKKTGEVLDDDSVADSGPVPPAAVDVASPKETAAYAVFQNKCVTCHGPGAKQNRAFSFEADGTPTNRDPKSLAKIIEKMNDSVDPMPPAGLLPPDVRKQIDNWAQPKDQ